MIPDRFITEYPARCLDLLEAMEPIAKAKDMLGTFAVLAAGSVLNIPWERLAKTHPINGEFESDLFLALRRVEKQPWLEAEFWQGREQGTWHFSRIVTDPNEVTAWRNEAGTPSLDRDANTVTKRSAGMVLRVLRNALAHGNIIYLNEKGHETARTRLHSIGLLSRYEETSEQREASNTYRLVVVPEADFLDFLKCWAGWLASFAGEYEIGDAA